MAKAAPVKRAPRPAMPIPTQPAMPMMPQAQRAPGAPSPKRVPAPAKKKTQGW